MLYPRAGGRGTTLALLDGTAACVPYPHKDGDQAIAFTTFLHPRNGRGHLAAEALKARYGIRGIRAGEASHIGPTEASQATPVAGGEQTPGARQGGSDYDITGDEAPDKHAA